MADIDITQLEADALIAMEKRRVDEKVWLFPPAGEKLAVALLSPMRLDLDGPPRTKSGRFAVCA